MIAQLPYHGSLRLVSSGKERRAIINANGTIGREGEEVGRVVVVTSHGESKMKSLAANDLHVMFAKTTVAISPVAVKITAINNASRAFESSRINCGYFARDIFPLLLKP